MYGIRITGFFTADDASLHLSRQEQNLVLSGGYEGVRNLPRNICVVVSVILLVMAGKK